MTIWKLGLFSLKTTLTFCQVIILLYTMSQAHKVVHTSLNSISGQHSASFHNVIKMLLIYFSQNGHFWNGVGSGLLTFGLPSFKGTLYPHCR